MTTEHNATHSVLTDPRQLYVDLLKKSLMCSLYEDLDGSIWNPRPGLVSKVVTALMPSDLRLVARSDRRKRNAGNDWPALAVTMIGAARLDNLQMCVETTIQDGMPGDSIETGVWRGRACILMRGNPGELLRQPARHSVLHNGLKTANSQQKSIERAAGVGGPRQRPT